MQEDYAPHMSKAESLPRAAKKLRELTTPKRDTSMEQIAEFCGVTRANVSLWAAGKHRPSYENMIKLRDKYGIELDEWE